MAHIHAGGRNKAPAWDIIVLLEPVPRHHWNVGPIGRQTRALAKAMGLQLECSLFRTELDKLDLA